MFELVKPIITIISIILLLLFIYGFFSQKIPIDYKIWTKHIDQNNIKIIDHKIEKIIQNDFPELDGVYDENFKFGYWFY